MRMFLIKSLTGFSFLLFPSIIFSQLNMVLQDSVTYTSGVNDVCGWTSADGNEYAIVGLHGGVAIVDIDVTPLEQVAYVPTEVNLWKDINTYSHYAYVSSEANVGILIIDLQYLPDSVKTYVWQDSLPSDNGPRPLRRAHTLWTDENGLLYLMGSNLNSGGVIMLDVASSPTDPIFLGYGPPIYSHDAYTRDSIIYSAEIYAGNLSIYDAHDPQNIVMLGQVKTPNEFTHNAWLSDDGNTMFTTDERPNSYVTSYDITDPSNIIELDRYREASTVGFGNVPHNVYLWQDNWLVVAYYACGTTIVDASRPDNLVEVGNFDSYLGADGGFPGVWGSFPWMPSGKILSSDRNSGLYVFEPTYVRACFLEGVVVDSITGVPIGGAEVSIISSEIVTPHASRIDGVFKMGKAVPGQYEVTVTKKGYYPKTISFNFINGEVLTPVIELNPIPTYQVSGKVTYLEGGNVPFAKVTLFSFYEVYELTCDENGDFLIPAAYRGSYDLSAGIWGHTYESVIALDEPRTIDIQLIPGYKDNFDTDLGWTIAGDATSGLWVRNTPKEQFLNGNVACGSEGDSPNDIGGFAFTTGAVTSENVLGSEVSGGTTWLISPPIDLAQVINNPEIRFDYWLCESPPNQYTGLSIWVTNGVDTVLVDELRNENIAGSWQSKSYPSQDLFPDPANQIQLLISATDTTTGQNAYVLKVHFDNFEFYEGPLSGVDPNTSEKYIIVYPNPVSNGELHIKHLSTSDMELTHLHFYDIQGRLLWYQPVQDNHDVLTVNLPLETGIYLMKWETATGAQGVEKIMVVK